MLSSRSLFLARTWVHSTQIDEGDLDDLIIFHNTHH